MVFFFPFQILAKVGAGTTLTTTATTPTKCRRRRKKMSNKWNSFLCALISCWLDWRKMSGQNEKCCCCCCDLRMFWKLVGIRLGDLVNMKTSVGELILPRQHFSISVAFVAENGTISVYPLPFKITWAANVAKLLLWRHSGWCDRFRFHANWVRILFQPSSKKRKLNEDRPKF